MQLLYEARKRNVTSIAVRIEKETEWLWALMLKDIDLVDSGSNGGFRDTANTNADSALESISIDRYANEPAPALFDPSPPLNYKSISDISAVTSTYHACQVTR